MPAGDGHQVVVRYKVSAPGNDGWDSNDNGRYVVRLLSDAVRDLSDVFAKGRTLGFFDVVIS